MVSFKLMLLVLTGQLVYGCKNYQQSKDLLNATTGFSQRLYQHVALNTSNIVYSPISIHSIFTMTSLGAEGTTKSEMLKTLGIKSAENVSTLYSEFIQEFVQNVSISIGNAIFVKSGAEIKPAFAEEVKTKFCAKIENFNVSAPGGPEKEINDYIAEATKNMIEGALPKGSITAGTSLVLVNTIFFEGTWASPFFKANKHPFFKQGNKASKTSFRPGMISGNMYINYKKDEPNQFEVGEIPYKGGRFSMYIALPQTDVGIASLEKYLSDPHNVNCLFMDLKIYYAEVKIPKFTTETTLDLMKPLKELGIVKAFGPGAEFPRITSGTTHISQVIHKVRFDVTLTGTTAAAETTEETNKGPALTTTEADIQFVADHPFLYFLRDRETGLILFQGKFSG